VRCPFCEFDNIDGVQLCESCGSELAGLDTPEARGGSVGRLMTDRIGDLELTPTLTASPDESVAEVIARMREARHGCAEILDGEKLVGIFTERDVMSRVVRPGLDAAATRVEQVMTPRPTTLGVENPPAHAIHRMVSQGFRHLPITRDGKLAGSISVRNLLRYIDREILGAKAVS
jgi:CBS domain-containing protein